MWKQQDLEFYHWVFCIGVIPFTIVIPELTYFVMYINVAFFITDTIAISFRPILHYLWYAHSFLCVTDYIIHHLSCVVLWLYALDDNPYIGNLLLITLWFGQLTNPIKRYRKEILTVPTYPILFSVTRFVILPILTAFMFGLSDKSYLQILFIIHGLRIFWTFKAISQRENAISSGN